MWLLWSVLVSNTNDVEVLSLMYMAFFLSDFREETEMPGSHILFPECSLG